MRVTIINHSDTLGGASVVSFRLMEALRAEGVDARMLVGRKLSDSPFVVQAASRFKTRIPFYLEHLKIFAQNGFSRKRLFQASIASDGLPLSRHPLVENADAIILNWVNQGLLSFDEIAKIALKKPTLWTMHDQWNFTGVCHHTGSCERFKTHCCNCPFLGWMGAEHDLSWRTFNAKSKLYADAPITFVALSQWLESRAKSSALLRNQHIKVIPNAFPVERFAEPPRYSKADLWLVEGKKIVLFCAARIDDPGKGLHEAINAINDAATTHPDILAVFAGECRNPQILNNLNVDSYWMGPVDADKIPSLMAHSAAVLSTSPFETFSTTMIEAQAAGATPVCFTHDGRGDIVEHGVTGYSLTEDPHALSRALVSPIPPENLRQSVEKYALKAVANRYIEAISHFF